MRANKLFYVLPLALTLASCNLTTRNSVRDGSASSSAATAEVDNYANSGLYFYDGQVSGDCDGSFSVSPDMRQLSLLLQESGGTGNDFSARAGGSHVDGDGNVVKREDKFCNGSILVMVPQGKRLVIVDADYRVFNQLAEDGSSSRMDVAYSTFDNTGRGRSIVRNAGSTVAERSYPLYPDGLDEYGNEPIDPTSREELVQGSVRVRSNCGGPMALNLNAHLAVTAGNGLLEASTSLGSIELTQQLDQNSSQKSAGRSLASLQIRLEDCDCPWGGRGLADDEAGIRDPRRRRPPAPQPPRRPGPGCWIY